MLSSTSSASLCFALSLTLSACQSMSYGYGYVNQLKQTVTVVEHGRNGINRSTFPPGSKQLPTEGDSVAERVEFYDAGHRQTGVFTLDDYTRSQHPGTPPVLVVSRSGVTLASREFWEKMAREWDGPSPSKAVPLSGGDGSSIGKAIIVQTPDKLQGVLTEYQYMRERFGYMWTYRSMERGWIPVGDRLYDMYEFVTHNGKRNVLYFDITAFWPPQRKASNQAMQRQ